MLAENGFDYILRLHIDEVCDFDTFAVHYREYFPLVFGYWDDLKGHGLVDYVVGNLRSMIKAVYVDVNRERVLGWRTRYSHQEFVEDLYTRIYVPELFHFGDDVLEDIPVNEIRVFRKGKDDLMNFILEWSTNKEKKAYRIIERLKKLEYTFE